MKHFFTFITTVTIGWVIFLSFHFFWVVILGLPPLTSITFD